MERTVKYGDRMKRKGEVMKGRKQRKNKKGYRERESEIRRKRVRI